MKYKPMNLYINNNIRGNEALLKGYKRIQFRKRV